MAYVGAVSTHVGRDGGRAATYTVFWSELRTLGKDGSLTHVPADQWARVKEIVSTAGSAAAGTPSATEPATGAAATPTATQPAAIATASAARPVGSALRLGLLALANKSEMAAAERVLENVDKTLSPRVEVQGRYEYAGSLAGNADLGFSTEVWMLCRTSADCVSLHDALFAPLMSGVGLLATAEERLQRDAAAAADPAMSALLGAANDLEARLQTATHPESVRAAAATAARDYWAQITSRLPLAGSAASAPVAGSGATNPSAIGPGAESQALGGLIEAGRVGAQIAGQPDLANLFTVTRAPVLEFTSAVTQGALVGTLGAGAATAGLLFAGVQALALFNDDPKGGALPAGLERLVATLGAASSTSIARMNAAELAATQSLDARVANLGAAVEVLRTDVERLESAGRRRVAADYQAAAARRVTAFETENERCFGLRYRDAASGRLRPADFRRCEDRFLQGAVRGAQYATRSSEFLLDARYLTAGDAQFPFHDHYPLFAMRGGLETRAALTLVDPVDWQQHAAALMRLYQEHPATASEQIRRRETLQSVHAAGARTEQLLATLTEARGNDGQPTPRVDLQGTLLTAYGQSLDALLARANTLDHPERHPYGKRVTEDLNQPPPVGPQRVAATATLAAAPLTSCYDMAAEAFVPETTRLVTESRRFFGKPIEPAEVQAAWQRDTVDAFRFELPEPLDLIPTPFLWAALEGLGRIEFCFAELRPAALAFTRTPGRTEDAFLGSTLIRAALEVRFTPDPARVPGALDAHPVTIARYAGERACQFDYHEDERPCSRAQCLQTVGPVVWQDLPAPAAACEGEPLVAQLRPASPSALPAVSPEHAAADATALLAILATAWQESQAPRRERLAAELRRSNEYDAASNLYLELHALSNITLGYGSDQRLDGMFAAAVGLPGSTEGGALSPFDVLRMITTDGTSTDAAASALRARIARIGTSIGNDARAIAAAGDAPGTRPPLAALRTTLTRLELASAAYGG
jgi:hypothetical protein